MSIRGNTTELQYFKFVTYNKLSATINVMTFMQMSLMRTERLWMLNLKRHKSKELLFNQHHYATDEFQLGMRHIWHVRPLQDTTDRQAKNIKQKT